MLDKITSKIAFFFSILVFLVFGIFLIASQQIEKINELSEQSISVNLKQKEYIDSLQLDFIQYFGITQSALSLLDLEQQRIYRAQLDLLKQSISEKLQSSIALRNENESNNSAFLKQILDQDLDKLHNYGNIIFDYMSSFAQMQAMDTYANQTVPIKNKILLLLDDTRQNIERELKIIKDQIDSHILFTNQLFIGSFLLLFITAITLSFSLWRSAIAPLSHMTALLKDSDDTDEITEKFLKRKDEIGNFAQAFQDLLDKNSKAKKELENSRYILDKILENLPIALTVKDADNDFQYLKVNEKAEKLLGLDEDQGVGKNDFDLFAEDMAQEIFKTDDYVLRTGETLDLERITYRSNNGNFIGHTRKILIQDHESGNNLLITTTENITKKIEAEDQLSAYAKQLEEQALVMAKARIEAEKANNAKTDFLANMSHELRTPLNSILGLTQIIGQKPMDKDTQEMFQTIEMSSKSLLNIVNDILDLSKIEAKEVVLERLPFDAYERIMHTKNSMKPLSDKKNITLNLKMDKDHLYVFGDPMHFSKIMNNLVSNAVNYTEKGSIEIRAITKSPQDSSPLLRIEVEDTGIGIREDRIDKIFEKFTQADTSTTRQYGGTGLGLTITKQLIELMGGEIGVVSKFGKGSTFWFEIPYEPATRADLIDLNPSHTQQKRIDGVEPISVHDIKILMMEDNVINQNFMEKLFSNLHIRNYVIAENGEEGLEIFKENEFDLILMDCHMPQMNGYDATSAIREFFDAPKKHVPIIAMTANAMPEDKERCIAIGMNDYIPKPIDIDQFKYTLSPWIDFRVKKSRLKKLSQNVEIIDENELENDNAIPPINLSSLESNAQGDQEFVKEIIGMCVVKIDKEIKELEDLINQTGKDKDDEWVEVSHSMKGNAGTLGAEEFRRACADAQSMSNPSPADKKQAVENITKTYQTVYKYLIAQKLYDPEAEQEES